jgi:hypothetical protein
MNYKLKVKIYQKSEANINELYSLEFPELSKNNHVQKAKSGIIVILSPSPLSF